MAKILLRKIQKNIYIPNSYW